MDPNGKGIQALISDEIQRRLQADPVSHLLATIDDPHLHIHHGHSFLAATWAQIAAGANYDWVLEVPDTAIRVHLFFDVEVEAETEILISGEPDYSGGNLALRVNRDGNSSTSATLLFKVSPTVALSGVPLWSGKLGSGKKSGGGSQAQNEIILKQDSEYLFRMINRSVSAAWISPSFSWYEVTPKD